MKDAEIALVDIDPTRLRTTYRVLQRMREQHNLGCTLSATLDRREALKNADFAVSMIQVGGLEPYKLDISIPLKYGVDQCVGDTMNPGGLFRGFRHVPVLLEMLRDMDELCPNVLFMNYANPMAICSWAMQSEFPHIASVGLCHGVQHTTNMLCQWLQVPGEECDVFTAGINHMAWFLTFKHKGRDLYPAMWGKLAEQGPIKGEEYRFEMFKATGYFMTESPGHLSEYLPYFRNRKDIQDLFGGAGFSGETSAYLNMCLANFNSYNREMSDMESGAVPVPYHQGVRSVEYAAPIMNARLTDDITRFAGNILNKGYITNLPDGCCVEIPIYVDRMGLHGTSVGELPAQCAALNQSNISMQGLAVKAAVDGDYEAAYHACLLDPLTAAALAPHEIRNMMDEMFDAQAQWLPQFKGKINLHPGAAIGRIETSSSQRQSTSELQRRIGHYDG